MNMNSWIVDKYAIRPAGDPDKCFYCKELLGSEHKLDCVLRSKTVVIRATVELIQVVPEKWTKEDIEFLFNESSSCANNVLDDIQEQAERLGCLCGKLTSEYLRDATKEDEDNFGIYIAEQNID